MKTRSIIVVAPAGVGLRGLCGLLRSPGFGLLVTQTLLHGHFLFWILNILGSFGSEYTVFN